MPDPTVDAALARGALNATPNKRLAREIATRHDRAQAAAGRVTWPAARVLPWMTFVAELVQAAQDAALALPPLWLDAAQARHLWQSIVRSELADKPLLDADAAGALAAEAWEHLHAYGAGMEGWRGFAGGEDVEAFVRWSGAYWKEVGRLDALDAARSADVVAAVARDLPGIAALDVLLIGFLDLSPQQQRLLDALQAAGANIAHSAHEARTIAASRARLVACDTSRDELACALDWAREHALRDPQARVGVVVLDLAQRRAAVRAACEERLCAPLQWPGQLDAERPYDISLGPPLADVPLVGSALALIELAHRPIDRSSAATLVRSPYLPDADTKWMRRAVLERIWLDRGTRALRWQALVDDLEPVDANLAARWRWATGELRRASRLAPREWVEQWRGWLSDIGWCEGRALSSDEYQADGAWSELLGTFARLATVAPALTADEALNALGNLARDLVFQPEAPGARIHVLGLLEASGLAFDALWVAGMAAEAWPRSPEPNPFLPVAWQREHGVPRASAEGELDFARALTARLAHSGREVVFSYAAQADDHQRTPSSLVAQLPVQTAAAPLATSAQRMFAQQTDLESIADAAAPPLAPGTRLPGGTGVVELQSDCPFRATAAHRLKAEAWPEATLGLTPIERGKLVHATLDAFWRTVRSHARLTAMDDEAVGRSVDLAFDQARAVLPQARWALLPPAIAATENTCVSRLVQQWLLEFERERPPFTVIDTEQRTTVALAGYTLDVRLDRVDALASGGVAVIDYKTGPARTPARWFDPRPQGMQVALYASAREQAAPDVPVRALVYAQLRPGEMKVVGLGADSEAWPALHAPGDVKGAALADWGEARDRLQGSVTALVAAFGAGDAVIVPRDRKKVCTLCRLRALCRIGLAAGEAAPADAEGYADE